MKDGFHNKSRKPGSAALNRVLTKQEKKRFRDFAVERGLDQSVADDALALIRTTHDVDILRRGIRKLVDEREAKGCDPDKSNSAVIPQERMAKLLAEAIAEAKKPFN